MPFSICTTKVLCEFILLFIIIIFFMKRVFKLFMTCYVKRESEDENNLYLVDSGIPGDGRCLFRSVVYGACLRSGKPSPSESHQRELADELRAKVQIELFTFFHFNLFSKFRRYSVELVLI